MKSFQYLLLGCILYGHIQNGGAQHTLFLIGDAGKVEFGTSPIKNVLQEQVSQIKNNATVLFLGDNIYPKGLPGQGERKFSQAKAALQAQVDAVQDLGVQVYFIPGNHDWQQGARKGYDRIVNQQEWIDSLGISHISFLPKRGCPGPEAVVLDEKLLLVILDTQWFLHPWDKPGGEQGCGATSAADILLQIRDIFKEHAGKRIILAAHHPLITYGEHGGVSSFKDHLFPLTNIQKSLYIPLPGLGTIYAGYRKLIGSVQDTPHPLYRQMSKALQEVMKEFPGTEYVSGHEHALEYIEKDSSIFIISGSGVKKSYVRKKGYAQFAEDVHGFVRLDVDVNGSQHIEFWQVDEEAPAGKKLWEKDIVQQRRFDAIDQPEDFHVEPGSTVMIKANSKFLASRSHQLWFGKNYRKEWGIEVEVPVFDIGAEQGGLKIQQAGGGRQTLSLRLRDSTGREWVLRSIEKYPEKAIPSILQKTFAEDIVQDQISAAHPYAPLVVPPLAKAAGVYHAVPKVVFIPDDPRLGRYRRDFAKTLALFEERPSDKSRSENFGNPDDVIGTPKVLEKLLKDNDHVVDQKKALRSRLFDLWIGDWDRHEDQWRWAVTETKKGEIYRPIPRDRDQTFFVNEGIIPKLVSRKWGMPMFQGFDNDIRWPSGLSFSARYFDRTFLTGLSRADWVEQANELKNALTDEVIDSAIRLWPPQLFSLHGEEIIAKLKSRRQQLEHYAIRHYEFLSRQVNVAGSNKRELFEIERMPSGNVKVTVFKYNKEREKGKALYDREFVFGETEEVRLYGLGGDDVFHVTGSTRRSILVRIIGGDGDDEITDESRVGGIGKKTIAYDVPGIAVSDQGELKDRISSNPETNHYDRTSFQYNRMVPLVYGNYNPDDGIFFGGGFLSVSHGFRKTPFRQQHLVLGSIAPLTASYNLRYQGKFNQVIGNWGLEVDAGVRMPNFVNNFFGMGNETKFDKQGDEAEDAIRFYRYRFEELVVEASLSHPIGKIGSFRIGPVLQRIELEEPEDNRFIADYAALLPYDLFNEFNSFGGVSAQVLIERRNHPKVTTRGVVWSVQGRSLTGLDKRTDSFSSLESSLSVYHSFRLPARITFALRAGGGFNTGSYEFYQAQILDGKTELRGYRKTRFYGDSKVYFNHEVRLRLFSFRSYLFPSHLGLLGFYDVGRVWYKDASGIDPSAGGESSVWHKGFGGGIWLTPFNFTVLSTEVGHSTEGTLVYVRLGFLF